MLSGKIGNLLNSIFRQTKGVRKNQGGRRRAAAALFSIGLASCLTVSSAVAAPADLDESLNGGGSVVTPIGNFGDTLRATAIQPDGKIVAVGYALVGNTDDFAIVRYNPDGSLDETFGGGDGIVTTPILSSTDQAFAVALQADGKIVVGGQAFNGSNMDFALVRYNTDGSLDTTFDTDGKRTLAIGAAFDFIHDIAIQPDGKIVAAGRAGSGSAYDIALARFTTTGATDNTFDADGKLTTPVGAQDDRAHAMVIQPDGKIVVAGVATRTITNGTGGDFALLRYNPSGSLDTTFDGDGKLITPFSEVGGSAEALALQPDGKLVAVGYYWNGENYDYALARYNPNGSLDTTFDGDGRLMTTVAPGTGSEMAYAVAVQPDGKIVFAGNNSSDPSGSFTTIRLNPNGTPDATFGNDGVSTEFIFGSTDTAYSLAIQPDGKILAAGATSGPNFDFLLVRYNGNEKPNEIANFDTDRKADVSIWNPADHNWYFINSTDGSTRTHFDWGNGDLGDRAVPGDYDGDGRADIAVFRPSEANWYVVKSGDGSTMLKHWGNPSDIPVPGDYDLDGKTDTAVFRPNEGMWYVLNSRDQSVTQRSWGTNGDVPVPADYDGDGATDFAVYRPADGNWYIITSQDRFARIVNWGNSTDKPVAADYDGDGRTDVAIFRASEANWYIRLWTGAVILQNWGEGTDKPVPADYDGDGKTDIAVWRASTFNWYILDTTTNAGRVVQLQQPGVPVASAYLPQQ
jgi:uncharacterized delta-60 repeat protein